jgi:hypothetical protein
MNYPHQGQCDGVFRENLLVKAELYMDVSGRAAFMAASQKTGGAFRVLFFLCLFAGFTAMAAGAQERRAVLVRGNTWVTGIPGFGNNAFPAISGAYRLEFSAAAGEEGEPVVSVWLCREPLRFAEDAWQPWSGSGLSVVQRREGEAQLLGVSLSGGNNLGIWTAVFQFPRGIEAAGLTGEAANALTGKWVDRVLYFLFLIKNPADVSLPAAFAF